MAIKSRLPKIAAELAAAADMAAHRSANRAAVKAKERVPVATGKLHDAIHVEREGLAAYMVVAGDREAFYGHIIEHGGRFVPPRPFIVPAAEDTRDEAVAILKAALRAL